MCFGMWKRALKDSGLGHACLRRDSRIGDSYAECFSGVFGLGTGYLRQLLYELISLWDRRNIQRKKYLAQPDERLETQDKI
jgi:hypothetical protein